MRKHRELNFNIDSQVVSALRSFQEFSGRCYPHIEAYYEMNDISIFSEIDYQSRRNFLNYLNRISLPKSVIEENIRTFDKLVIDSFPKSAALSPKATSDYIYNGEELFLLYINNYEMASLFSKTTEKEELYWNFKNINDSQLANQTKAVMLYIISNITDYKEMRSTLLSLKILLNFCLKNNADNYLHISDFDEAKFKIYWQNTEPRGKAALTKIINFVRKIVFITAAEFHKDSNVWYLERFKLDKKRINISCPILTLSFLDINNDDNKLAIQAYMDYLLGISDRSLETIRSSHQIIKNFLKTLESKNKSLTNYDLKDFDRYLHLLGSNSNETKARYVNVLFRFIDYIECNQVLKQNIYIPPEYKFKVGSTHITRTVPEPVYVKILKNLDSFPPDLRLMYLLLLCTGLRKSEICVLKREDFNSENGFFCFAYQTKTKSTKRIPIPPRLFEEVCNYQQKYQVLPDNYLFKNKKGGPYNSNTFSINMKAECLKIGIAEEVYSFKAHDYRHLIATEMYSSDCKHNVIKRFLDHNNSWMTDRYIDNKEEKALEDQRIFLSKNSEYLERISNGKYH